MFVPVAATGAEDDPNFWPNGAEKHYREQYLAWLGTKHGNALDDLRASGHANDSCLACHSTEFTSQDGVFAQDTVNFDNVQFTITCVGCHAPHGSDQQNQLNQESYELCISCHNATGKGNTVISVGSTVHHPMREMFEGISFLGLEPTPSKHFANEAHGPICASCHMVGTATNAVLGDSPTHTFNIIKPTDAADGQPDSCTGCHTLARDPDNTKENLTFAIENVQNDTHDRVDSLRADWQDVMDAHPEWDPKATDKSDEQVMAERINTLVSFVESDGSWGFHNPEYTDKILSEAEGIMNDLLDKLGM
jgi:predicted CXXCH cytochrome family protein